MMKIIIVFLIKTFLINGIFSIYDFPKGNTEISPLELNELLQINEQHLQTAIELGVESVNQENRLETNLINAKVIVENGSISHAQLLEGFPNEAARDDNNIARQILKSTLYILHSDCTRLNINYQDCAKYLSNVKLPPSDLRDQCLNITSGNREGHHAFRRLLPPRYKDGVYAMFEPSNTPRPREISKFAVNNVTNTEELEDNTRNLILVQWAQFIEHDLSKPVTSTMSDGTHIECCTTDQYTLKPRHIHPACAPLLGVETYQYGRIPCLNYVRSALAVNSKCKFGSAQQLNQASDLLDLSQLYGYTEITQKEMRTFKDGELKTSTNHLNEKYPLLPLAKNKEEFCVSNHNPNEEPCFMAGDNRVNSNPFINIIHTIFLRSHNSIARKLKRINPTWNDEKLYKEARYSNIDIYRCIVYNEWLPMVLGEKITNSIINTQTDRRDLNYTEGVSNEFSFAAIHFYYSMFPNILIEPTKIYPSFIQENIIDVSSRTPIQKQLFALKDQFYKSDYISHPFKLEKSLEAMLVQKAMKMDSKYEDSVLTHFLKPNTASQSEIGMDGLAWDIQRGRDHGITGYTKYLEICENVKINNWNDLRNFIHDSDINRLTMLYKNVQDIDLIIGGISEIPKEGSLVGPTFTCILAEQFSNIKNLEMLKSTKDSFNSILGNCKGYKFLCETTNLLEVPRNIFLAPSETNPYVSCTDT